MLIGVPISLLCIGLVIGAQVLLELVMDWNIGYDENGKSKNTPLYWKILPGVVNSFLIKLFGKLYTKVSKYLIA